MRGGEGHEGRGQDGTGGHEGRQGDNISPTSSTPMQACFKRLAGKCHRDNSMKQK